jgi:D-alanyl-lipoteichoic acid acyltransferase DltB (MBOAT superfamily)
MLFTTVEFSIFFFFTFLLAAATATRSLPFRLVLTIASYVFYGWSDWRYAFLLFECSLVNYLLGICLMSATSKKSKKSVLMIGVLANISLLFYFKYFSFLASNLNINLSWNIALPIGISFYTFQAISYLVDIYKQKIPPATSFVDFLLFKSFFPQLIAGPLVRASEMLPQLNSRTFMTKINLTAGLTRIAIGLVKKVIIAHYLATNLVDPVFAHPGNYSSLTLLIAAYGYAAQIYCDFSGYCDMAIGIAILLGFKFPENFNQPYRAHSLQDFWRRWHITL